MSLAVAARGDGAADRELVATNAWRGDVESSGAAAAGSGAAAAPAEATTRGDAADPESGAPDMV